MANFDDIDEAPAQAPQEPVPMSGEFQAKTVEAPKSFDDIEEHPQQGSFDNIEEPGDKQVDDGVHSTPMQKGLGMVEAAGRGATFGLSSLAETGLGLTTKDDIKAREAALDPNVVAGADATGAIASMFVPGVGEGWLLAKGAQLAMPIAKEASAIAKIGRLAVRGAIEMGGFASGDELSDALLDKGHDGMAVAGHIIGASALGLLTGGLFGSGEQVLEKIQNAKIGEYLDNVAIGLGAASKGPEHVEALNVMNDMVGDKIPQGVKHGIKLYAEMSKHIAGKMVDTVAGITGAIAGKTLGMGGTGEALIGNAAYQAAKKWIAPYADKLASKTVNKNVVTPVLIKALALGQESGITSALNHGTKAAAGLKAANRAIEDLFNIGGKEAAHALEEHNDKLNEYMENGGIDQQIDEMKNQSEPQAFAGGGSVEPKPVSSPGMENMYPAQHQMLTAAKGRVSNYLNTLRPGKPVGMLYDKEHKDEAQHRAYRSALSVANAPLSVLTHIKHGTVTQDHVKHLASMYPEVHDHLSKELTKKMVEMKHEGKEPPKYHVRQGLAMLMGSPLDSSMTPQSIMAAQATFQMQQGQPQPQQGQKNKKSTGSLSKFSKDYQTPGQSRESRESKD